MLVFKKIKVKLYETRNNENLTRIYYYTNLHMCEFAQTCIQKRANLHIKTHQLAYKKAPTRIQQSEDDNETADKSTSICFCSQILHFFSTVSMS